MLNLKPFLTSILILICLLPKAAISQSLSKTIPFAFTLKQSSTTSAGVFTSSGKLRRTLWSAITYSQGTHMGTWDGNDDLGNVVTDTNLVVRVLSNNVKAVWQGVLGNTSDSMTGPWHISPRNQMNSMAFAGKNCYYTIGYNEQGPSTQKFNTDAPNSSTVSVYQKGMQGRYVASDGSNVYWAGVDPNILSNSFVFSTNVDDDVQTSFPNGISYKTKYGSTYFSVVDFVNDAKSAPSGLAVQKSGVFLFVARKELNTIDVINKASGLLVTTITSFTAPRELAIDGNDDLWMITGNNTIAKYKVNNNGTLSSAVFGISGVTSPSSIGISPDHKTIVIIDSAMASQQLKAFNINTGAALWTMGQVGGYHNSVAIRNDKFYFSDNINNYENFIAFAPDSSFWVMDAGNCRAQHYSADRNYIERIQYRPSSYSTEVDDNNPTRVFSDYLEFAVDYSKPLDNGTNNSWNLVNNWGSNVLLSQDNRYLRLKNVTTLNNKRTYALALLTTTKWEVVELSGSGLRFTGVQYTANADKEYLLYADGSLRAQTRANIGEKIYFYKKLLTGFDNLGNPQWGTEQIVASTPKITSADPVYDGNRSTLASGEITSSGVVMVFSPTSKKEGYHLGGVKMGGTDWLWETAPSTHYTYTGNYPTDGYFDIGNRVNTYAGSKALALGRSVFWGYHGEFWKNSQVNKWTQVYEDGLMVQTFGVTGVDNGGKLVPGMAGNSFAASFVFLNGDSTTAYMYQNDESLHGGVHRWMVSGFNTIQEQTVNFSDTAINTIADGVDLLEALPKKDTLRSNTFGWNRNPESEDTKVKYGQYWTARTGTRTYTNTQATDLYLKYEQTSGKAYSVTRDLGKNVGVSSWKLKGVVNYQGNTENINDTAGGFIDVIDMRGKIITRLYNLQKGKLMTYMMGNKVIVNGTDYTGIKQLNKVSQPLEITVSKAGATFKYATYKAITTPIFDINADWTSPATLRFLFATNGSARGSIIDIDSMKFSITASLTTTVAPPMLIAKDNIINTLKACHPFIGSEILVSENNGSFETYYGEIQVGVLAKPKGYWKFKVKATDHTNESAIVESPAFTLTNTTPVPPQLVQDDSLNTIDAFHDLGNSEILVSINNESFTEYTGQLDVGNISRAAGYWKFKIKSAYTRNESSVVSSQAFSITPDPPTLHANDTMNVLTAVSIFGDSVITVSTNNGSYQPYTGQIYVTNRTRPAGYWKFKIKAGDERLESIVIASPEFTYTPDPPGLYADDKTNILSASQILFSSDILVSTNNGPFMPYTDRIYVGNITRPSAYWKFKVQSAPGRSESAVTVSPEYKLNPTPPILTANDTLNILSADHPLGSSEILVSVNNGPFTAYTGQINIGNNTVAEGYYKFKIRSAQGRNESEVALSPYFTYLYTPDAPDVIADDKANTIAASHAYGASVILVSENDSDYIPYYGKIDVGNVVRPEGYWKFKIKAGYRRAESPAAGSPVFTVTPKAPELTSDDDDNTLTATHPLGNSEILVSENGGTFKAYTGPINVGNVNLNSGYYQFKIKSASGRTESSVVVSPAFTYIYTPIAPTLTADDNENTLYAYHSFGPNNILVSENDSEYKAYEGTIYVGDVKRPKGYYKFKTKAGYRKNESPVAISPEFTTKNINSTPAPPTLVADDVANTLTFLHALGISEILVSIDGGDYSSRTTIINVGNVTRAVGYYKFKIKSAVGRNESAIVNSPAFNTTPSPPTLTAQDIYNTLSAYHSLGSSEILVSVNDGAYVAYTGKILIGNINKPEGYWKFKTKAAEGRSESLVAISPAFTANTLAKQPAVTPEAPVLDANDTSDMLSASHTLGSSEIMVSENSAAYVAYTGEINVGNIIRPIGYWKFKIKSAEGRTESAEKLSPAFTAVNIPDAPVLNANDAGNTLSASHSLGSSQILVSENDSEYLPYLGYISVGNVARPAGYWKFKIKAAPGRRESMIAESPAFTRTGSENYTPQPPTMIANDTFNIITATHPLGSSEILVSINDGEYYVRTVGINVGNVARPAGYYKCKIKAAPGRNESAVVSSPAFNYTPPAPVLSAQDVYNTLKAYHSLGVSEILVSENNGDYQAYTGKILVGNVNRQEGYWKFKIKAAEGRTESPVVKSPVFTINTVAQTPNATPAVPTLFANDSSNVLSAAHALGTSEILMSENSTAYTAYTGQIDVGNKARPIGYWKFKIRSAEGRNESAEILSPAFTSVNIPDAPVLTANDAGNTLSASHSLGTSQILMSENDQEYRPYIGYINVGNVSAPTGYWKFKIKAAPGRGESAVVGSPAFLTTPSAPVLIADDAVNILKARHSLGNTEIVVSENNGSYTTYTGQINVGNTARSAGYWKFKIKAADGRTESAVVSSPAFTNTSVARSGGVVAVDENGNNLSEKNSLQVYPNPVAGKSLNMSLSNFEKGTYSVTLISNSGQVVMNKTITVQENIYLDQISIEASLQKGVYLLRISGKKTTISKVVIKQ